MYNYISIDNYLDGGSAIYTNYLIIFTYIFGIWVKIFSGNGKFFM